MNKEKKKESVPNFVKDRPVPVIKGSDESVIRLSEDQMRNLAEHFADSTRHEMY